MLLRPRPSVTFFPYTTLFRSSWLEAMGRYFVPLATTMKLASSPVMNSSTTTRLPALPNDSPDSMPFRVARASSRSEEHTSELQSRGHLVCRLLHEKQNKHNND